MSNRIQHLVLLMMENRSFDHYLGALTLEGRDDVDGLRASLPPVPASDGTPISPWAMDDVAPGYPDPPHNWDAMHGSWNDGALDGWVTQYEKYRGTAQRTIPMGHYTRKTLPVYYALADEFTVCDRWFGGVLSSTWPNRKYFHSGQRDSDRDTEAIPAFPGFQTTPFYDALEDARDPDNPGAKLTWRNYFSDMPFLSYWYRFAAYHALGHFSPIAHFAADCRANRLPSVSVIDPPFTLADDHPAHDPKLGQKFVGLVVDALTNSEAWEQSALLIVYDENGGFYDHVPPPEVAEPPAEDSHLGFRVPAILVSPYARKRHACHTQLTHTSVMKSIHERWGVDFPEEQFGTRWKSSNSFWDDCFDFEQPARPRGTYTGQPFRELDWGTGVQDLLVRGPHSMEALLDRIFVLPELKGLDGRSVLFNMLNALEHEVIGLKRMI